jgi:pyrroloquinoline quinone (PQQ) biosynthesis protein C
MQLARSSREGKLLLLAENFQATETARKALVRLIGRGKGDGMQLRDSRAVSKSLDSYARDRLIESDFFSALSAGQVQPEHVRDVFGQYYVWRNRFHRWFGLCVAKSAPFGDARNVPRVLAELIACLDQEIKGSHHKLALSFLTALGIADPTRIEALPVTESYAESFLRCYFAPDRTGDEALAALAGRELVAPGRNQIIISAISEHYGVTSGLEFFRVHTDLEVEHFRALWEALAQDTKADAQRLIEAARMEIWEHITFWDDVYFTIRQAQNKLAS